MMKHVGGAMKDCILVLHKHVVGFIPNNLIKMQ
jgi:hypothetical protein